MSTNTTNMNSSHISLHSSGNQNESDNTTMFQHLNVRRVFARTLELFGDRLDVYMAISGVVSIPSIVASVVIFGLVELEEIEMTSSTMNGSAATFVQNHQTAIMVAFRLQWFFSMLAMVLGEGAIIRAVAETYAHSQPSSWLTCLKVGLQHGCSLLAVFVLIWGVVFVLLELIVGVMVMGEGLFFILFFLGLVALSVFISRTFLTNAVIIVENKGPINSLRRSLDLSDGRKIYIFFSAAALWLAKIVAMFVIHLIFNPSNDPLRYMSFTGIIVSAVPNLFYLPLHAILKMVLYTSIRVDKEGLSKSVLQHELVEPMSFPTPTSILTDPAVSTTPRDYRQVALMDEDSNKDSVVAGLVSDFA